MFLFLSIQKDPIKNSLLMDFKIATSKYVSATVLGASGMTSMQFSNYLQEENGEQQLRGVLPLPSAHLGPVKEVRSQSQAGLIQ